MQLIISVIDVISIVAIPGLILFVVIVGAFKKVKIYAVFVEGAKEGFNVGVRIIPYLVAMLVAIGIFRAGGAMEILASPALPVDTRLATRFQEAALSESCPKLSSLTGRILCSAEWYR